MYFDFDEEGVLNISPEDYYDVIVLKWFLKEFSSHGARMLNVETEIKEGQRRGGEQHDYPRAYGFAEHEPAFDPEPFSPEMVYDNRVSNIRDYRFSPREYGQRGGGGGGGGSRSGSNNEIRGERGREGSGTRNTSDRDRDNNR